MNYVYRYLLLCVWVVTSLSLAGMAQTGSEEHIGRVVDWSYHHIVVSGPISTANLDRAQREPRILFHLAERNLRPAAGFSRAQIGGDDNSSRGQFRFGPIRGRGFPGRPPGRPPASS